MPAGRTSGIIDLCIVKETDSGDNRFEKRFLGYWMEGLQGQAMVPYGKVALDRRGARHMVAWHTQAYLLSKGVDWRGGGI